MRRGGVNFFPQFLESIATSQEIVAKSLEQERAEKRAKSVSASEAINVGVSIEAQGWTIGEHALRAVREEGTSDSRHVAALVPLPTEPD